MSQAVLQAVAVSEKQLVQVPDKYADLASHTTMVHFYAVLVELPGCGIVFWSVC